MNTGAGGFVYFGGTWSPDWQVFVTDFNGDRRSDILVYQPSTGLWCQCLNAGLGAFTFAGGR